MTDGEEKKSSLLLDSFKEVLGRFSYRPENRQYIIFRAMLLGVAALLAGKAPINGRKTGIIISGGNIDEEKLLSILEEYD